MPILYKIFLFLLIKSGAVMLGKGNQEPSAYSNSTSVQNTMMSFKPILSLQGDIQFLEEAITICQEYLPAGIDRHYDQGLPEASRAVIQFHQMADECRTKISHQLIIRLAGKILVEWKSPGGENGFLGGQ